MRQMRNWVKRIRRTFRLFNKNRITEDHVFVWSFVKFFMTNEKLKQAAAALTYHTLFALVPIMALFVAVANIMGYDEVFRAQVELFLEGQESIAKYLLDFADRYLMNARMNYWLGAGVGLLFLIYSLFSIFQTVDEEVNSLWNLKSHGLKKQVLVFLFVLLLPFVSMILIALWLSISSYFEKGIIFEVNIFVVSVSAYSALLFAAYKFIPNTKVEVKYALYSAIVCGALFALLQYSVSYVFAFFTSYRNIYGDLATLVLFVLWIYFSWMICLAGSRWNYLLQEAKRLDVHNRFKKVSLRYKKFLYLLVVADVVAFQKSSGNNAIPLKKLVESISCKYGLPTHVVMEIKEELVFKEVLLDDAADNVAVADDYVNCNIGELIAKLDDAGKNEYAIEMTAKVQDSEDFWLLWRMVNENEHEKLDQSLLEFAEKENVAEE